MTAPRLVVQGATTAITRRTTFRKAFLGPWHPMVQDIWLYALAYAQAECDVAVHMTSLVVSHHHTDVTPSHDNLPLFNERLHRDVSCALHALLCQEKYDAPRELFDDRQPHTMRLVDAAAQASQLVYEYLNPVAAGLVQRPEHMPGRVINFDAWKTGYIEVERPPVYFSRNRPERLRLILTPPPLLYQAFGGDLDRLVYHMNRLSEEAMRAIRGARRRPVMGAQALKRMHAWSEPSTLREPGGHLVPTFRIGARGIVGVRERIHAARETHHFRAVHREARLARREGKHDAVFPFGTYAMRVHHGAPVPSEPEPDAVLARPGPLLCDVQAELALCDDSRLLAKPGANAILDEVRQALAEEARDIVEHTDLGPYKGAGMDAPGPETVGPGERAPAVVRHRLERRRDEPSARAPARIITLRDRRRGRPPRSERHGSDPPV